MATESILSHFHVKKGFDISLEGEAKQQVAEIPAPDTCSLKPTDFLGITRPKLLVSQGDSVRAGTPVFYDKNTPAVQYCSPVSGEVIKIVRGAKRCLLEIVVLADKDMEYESLPSYNLQDIRQLPRDVICEQLCRGGAWPHLLQRPYGIVASPQDIPRDIFVSTFDSHPLAPESTFALAQDREAFEAGMEAVKRLSGGHLHFGLRKGVDASYFSKQQGARYYSFQGPHPVGNVGVQIYHIRPIGKGESVWTTTLFGLIQIGRLLLHGRYDTSMRVACTGPEVLEPQYYNAYSGSSIKGMVKNNLRSEQVRYISGNALTGERILGNDGHIGFYHQQVTVLKEGNYMEPFGWILPSINKLSYHRGIGLLSFLFPHKKYRLDTNTHGEHRAFVQTGALERLVPMDILPTHLVKAIMAEDYDAMEGLGIYEVVEEDVALCEFADPSKHEFQKILRQGLDLIRMG